jgi:hypothetical protein
LRIYDAEKKKLRKQIADLQIMVQQQRDARNEMEIQMIGYRKIKHDLEARLDKPVTGADPTISNEVTT